MTSKRSLAPVNLREISEWWKNHNQRRKKQAAAEKLADRREETAQWFAKLPDEEPETDQKSVR